MTPLFLLAQVQKSSKLREIAEGFQHNDSRPTELPGFQWFIRVFGLLFVALLFVAWWSQRKSRKAARFTPFRLYAQALHTMGLGLFDRILLRFVARSSEMDQPVVLLFSPALLDQQISAWTGRLSLSPVRRYFRRRLNAAMDAIFVDE